AVPASGGRAGAAGDGGALPRVTVRAPPRGAVAVGGIRVGRDRPAGGACRVPVDGDRRGDSVPDAGGRAVARRLRAPRTARGAVPAVRGAERRGRYRVSVP